MWKKPEDAVTPRKAVATILRRESDEVLLGRRNESMRFMGGTHVFPGGGIDDDESAAHVVHAEDDAHARAIHAAVREVFEETGVLCVEGQLPGPDDLHEARIKLLQNELHFDEILAEGRLVIPADRFVDAGSWLTPGNSPIRFDTQYYLYEHDGRQQERLIEGEMTALDWLRPAQARRLWHDGIVDLPAPVAHTLQHLAMVPLPQSLELLRRPTDRYPGIPARVEWRRGIHWIPLVTRTIPPATHTNCVVIGERDLYVIDPGSDDEAELAFLFDQLDHMIALGGRVKGILLTHSHIDHVAGAPRTRQRYEAPVWAHEAVKGDVEFDIDREIRDDDLIRIEGDPDWRLRAMHTPGHDPGHLCFMEETTRTLIAGDMVANPGTIIISRSFKGDMGHFMDSLKRLVPLDTDLLIPSHGHPLREAREWLEENIRHRQWREDKVRQALETEGADFNAVLQRAYDDVPPAALPFAEHSLDAILHKLGVELGP